MSGRRTFYLIRHAESLGNAGAADAGPNPGLSTLGRRQAAALAAHLASERDIRAIWSSPFERAVQTACAIGDALDLPVRLEPLMCEFFYADWFDLKTLRLPSLPEIAASHPRARAIEPEEKWWPAKGEDFPALYARLARLAERLLAETQPGKTVVVGHGASVAALAAALTGAEAIPVPLVANASITEVCCDDSGGVLRRVSDTAHLKGLLTARQ